jgi:Fe-S cluster assembly protein SufD
VRDALPGAGLAWLATCRADALKAFAEAGLPHRRLEDWRYTDLARALDKATLSPAPRPGGAVELPDASVRPSIAAFHDIDRHVVLFVNGRLQGDLAMALPQGVTLERLGDALGESWVQPLVEAKVAAQAGNVIALNTARMRDGLGLRLCRGMKLDKPLHLVFLASEDGAAHVRLLVRLEEGAEATIFETHVDAGATSYFLDLVTDVSLAEGASLTHVKVQDEGADAVHLASLMAEIGAGARLSSFSLTLGAKLSRSQSFITFKGEGGEAHVNGATALAGSQHGDHFCMMDHAVPGCASSTLFKTVLDGASTGVFQGNVIVRPDAQKTDGRQMSNALLLSRDASMNAKPELEIYADDVQCAHGSTIGELNRDAIFFLRARGIDEQTARQLLVSAFLDEAFATVPHEAAREDLRELAAIWFERDQEKTS